MIISDLQKKMICVFENGIMNLLNLKKIFLEHLFLSFSDSICPITLHLTFTKLSLNLIKY